ncbi:MAG: ABC transporter permease [Mangrovibacterium sp.]
MNLNFLKIFFRNQRKHKVISAINLVGLTIGILSALFILEYVFFERSFDHYHEKGPRVVRVAYDHYQDGKLQWCTANSFYPIGQWLKENYREVENWAVLVRKYNITVSSENAVGDKVFYTEAKTYYASNSLFNLFTIPLLEGGEKCIEEPNTVAISQRAAKRYFGKADPLGKVLIINNSEKYTVTAVYRDIPANSHLKSDFFFSLTTYTNPRPGLNHEWHNDLFHTYLLLAPGVDLTEFCNRAMPELIAKNYQDIVESANIRDVYYFQRVPDIHLHSNIEYETEPPGNAKIMNILFWFAIFLLAVAWINYINLVTAQSLERAREIDIKKINGARKISLVWQFLSEALLFNLGSLIVTLLLFFVINPFFKSVTNIQDFNFFREPGFLKISLLVFFSGIAASSIYPALVLSSYKPVAVLKGKFKNTVQGLLFRKGLVTVQFVISIALLIGTLVTFRQASYLMEKDMGIDYTSTLVIRAPRTNDNLETRMNKLELFKNQITEFPEVKEFTFASDIPGEEITNFFWGYRKGYDATDGQAYYQIAVDDHYLDFFKVKMLSGRKFHQNETFEQNTIIMNKLAAERFGYPDPADAVGKIMVREANREYLVVGVVDDFYYRSIKLEPMPTVITLNQGRYIYMVLRLQKGPADMYTPLVSKLKSGYQAIYPNHPFDYFSLDDKMMLDLKPDKTFALVFSLFSVLAILVAVIGIVGLILITINQNLKELGIRKALGAELGDMSGLLSKQLFAQFVIALTMAIPVSYYGYKHWFLSVYIHRIDLSWWFFVLPVVLLSVVIAFIVVTLAGRVFRMNLRDVLQYE